MAASVNFFSRVVRRLTGRSRDPEFLAAEKRRRKDERDRERAQTGKKTKQGTAAAGDSSIAATKKAAKKALTSMLATTDIKQRVRLAESLNLTEKLAVEGFDLTFAVNSMTAYSRVSRVKEGWTVEWVKALPEGTVLWDVGANIGVFALLAAARPEVDKVVAVEPSYLNYASLMTNVLQNGLSDKVTGIPAGLGSSTGYFPLTLENTAHGGSLHSFGEIFKVSDKRNVEGVGSVSCYCTSIDDLVKTVGIPFPTHFKIDVDGFELEVLRGGAETLRDPRVKGLQVEAMDHDLALPRRREVTELVESFGFKLDNAVLHENAKTKVADLQFVRGDIAA